MTHCVYPDLVSCTVPVEQILPSILTMSWSRGMGHLVRAQNIHTIGNLSALKEEQVYWGFDWEECHPRQRGGYSLQCLIRRAPPKGVPFSGLRYMKGQGNVSFRSVKRRKGLTDFFLWNARLELLFNTPQRYNTIVTCHCMTLHYNTLQMHYVTLHYTVNFNTNVTIQKKICSPLLWLWESRENT